MHSFAGFTPMTKEDVDALITEAVGATDEGKWIDINGYNPMLIAGMETPTMKVLDAFSTKHPIFVMASSAHSFYANSLAFELAGINNDTKDPTGGEYVRDAEGNLTGQMNEGAAAGPFLAIIPKMSSEKGRQLLKETFDDYARVGITTIATMATFGTFEGFFNVLYEEASKDECPVRVATYHQYENFAYHEPEQGDKQKGNHWFQRVKFFGDGSPYCGTMATKEPYLDTDLTRDGLGFVPYPNRGFLVTSFEDCYKEMLPHHKAGRQLATHTHGERAIQLILDVYEALLTDYPRDDHRYRLEHCGLITKEQLQQAKQLGVTPSIYIELMNLAKCCDTFMAGRNTGNTHYLGMSKYVIRTVAARIPENRCGKKTCIDFIHYIDNSQKEI